MARYLAIVLLLLAALSAAAAADKPAEPKLPDKVVTHHTIRLDGKQIDYDAVAEMLPVINAKGATTASIYTIADVMSGGGERPVTFAFNGGPGAASVFLHLGALGPRILETPESGAVPPPPYRLVDNPASWLAFTDLVFIDPVGTGFSRGEGKEENPDKPFWDVHADLQSLQAVVRLWLTRHGRWQSPVFLAGESYGGFRAAAMARPLARDDGVTVSGLVLISPALDLSLVQQSERDVLANAFELPSETAAAAALRGGEADLAEVEHFALSDYLVGLAALKGEPAESDPFIARVAALTGLRDEVVRHNRGRISGGVFAHEIRRAESEVVSLYDGTVARPARPEDDNAGDPVLDPAVGAYTAAFNAYAREALDYHTDLPYRVLPGAVSRQWDWQGRRELPAGLGMAMSSLEATLLEHPHTKVLIANGRYDLVTPYLGSRWLVDQLVLPAVVRAEIRLRVYEGGHMMYMRPQSRAALARDAAQLYGAGAAP